LVVVEVAVVAHPLGLVVVVVVAVADWLIATISRWFPATHIQ
jgi:hypothetical protein